MPEAKMQREREVNSADFRKDHQATEIPNPLGFQGKMQQVFIESPKEERGICREAKEKLEDRKQVKTEGSLDIVKGVGFGLAILVLLALLAIAIFSFTFK